MYSLIWIVGCLLDREGYLQRRSQLVDLDGDGFVAEDDCDDGDASRSPDAQETCDGVDEDCDGQVDDDPIDPLTWYSDSDGDGYGDMQTATEACEAPATTWTNRGDDCDDTDVDSFPGGEEVPYDGADQDCDGADLTDVDGDGHAGSAVGGDDCDDGDPGVYPGAEETPYDGTDQDCSGGDEDDLDGDGVTGEAAGGDDCDDADSAVFPGAEETWANGYTDNDCDGEPGAATLEYGGSAWLGESAGARLGNSIEPVGDLDANGRADYLVCAPYESGEYEYGGAIYLLSGSGGGSVSAATRMISGGEYWFMGGGLGVGPDVDGDSVEDLVVSAAGYGDGLGAAWVVSGARLLASSDETPATLALGSVLGDEPGAYAGSSTVFLGDIVGDGSNALAVAAPLASPNALDAAGQVGVFLGTVGGDVAFSNADLLIEGYYAGAHFGDSLGQAGDVDGDGLVDYFVGFEEGDVAVVLPGGIDNPEVPDDAIFRLTRSEDGEDANARMVGDVDGDGANDIGCVVDDHTFRFFTSLAVNRNQVVGESQAMFEAYDGAYGTEPESLGDLDGDGLSETLLPLTWFPEYNSPAAAVLAGADVSPGSHDFSDVALLAVSSRSSSGFGYHARLAGDVDGDSFADVLLSGIADDEAGVDAGAVIAIPLPRR